MASLYERDEERGKWEEVGCRTVGVLAFLFRITAETAGVDRIPSLQ